jgi:type IV secretory pathway component VirB8
VYFSKLAANEADVRYRKIITNNGTTTKTTWTTRIVFKVSKTMTKKQADRVGIGFTVKHYQNSEDSA